MPQASQDDRDSRSVFVKNVHFSADKKDIEAHFEECGKINHITIRVDKITQQSLG